MAIFSKKEEVKGKPALAAVAAVLPGAKIFTADVLVQPRISEKSGRLLKSNQYVFVVKNTANKIEVRKAVEALYKVRVVAVNVINTQGKNKNFGRAAGRTSDFKKAVVTLKAGDKIEAAGAA